TGYVDAHESDTSVGARLEMWRTGIMLIEERPLFGWGKKGYMDRVKELISDGTVAPVVADHSHLHNEYIDAWVKRGIPGLLSTLLLYGLPLMLFLQLYRHSDETARPYILGGVLTTVSYIVFGLTQAFLTHDDGVTLYAFTVVILWSLAREPQA
ncbi:MAG TPA: O-antigen ligase family protein, partial [Rhodocyclaceae bacterium]|nr:O-antigen ligase family protein [Rhodocyclaceae bacterium]